MTLLLKLSLLLVCIVSCYAGRSMAPANSADIVNHALKVLQDYEARGGCYQKTMDAMAPDCEMVMADEAVRNEYGVALTLCNAATLKIAIPKQCQGKTFKNDYCLKDIGKSAVLTQLFALHSTNSHSVCLFHKQMDYTRGYRTISEMMLRALTQNTELLLEKEQRVLDHLDTTEIQIKELRTATSSALVGLVAQVDEHTRKMDSLLNTTMEAVTNATTVISALIRQQCNEIIESARGWVPGWVTGAIAVLQAMTGLSFMAVTILLVIATIVAGIVWSFELNKQWKLNVIAAGLVVYLTMYNIQRILVCCQMLQAFALHRAVLCVCAGICISTSMLGYHLTPARPYKRQFPPNEKFLYL